MDAFKQMIKDLIRELPSISDLELSYIHSGRQGFLKYEELRKKFNRVLEGINDEEKQFVKDMSEFRGKVGGFAEMVTKEHSKDCVCGCGERLDRLEKQMTEEGKYYDRLFCKEKPTSDKAELFHQLTLTCFSIASAIGRKDD